MSDQPILIVEDDPHLREALSDALERAGYPVLAVADGDTGLATLAKEPVSLVISDVRMEPMDGHELFRRIRASQPVLPVVLMTAYGTIERAVSAMRDGASDYLIKPFEAGALLRTVDKWRARARGDTRPVAEDPRMAAIIDLARRVAASDATVMISGESGVGKEVVARFIHEQSPRVEAPLVAINCAAIPENMLEAVLFGHEKGAFTGAHAARAGKFEQAQGGTLLLDEISEMSLALQAKLLRVLQEREVERVGGQKSIALDVRVLATTNRCLRDEVAAGRFREDLFYRLNVFPLNLPALRERPGDIVPLARRLLARVGGKRPVPTLSAAARARLREYGWTGNVRELDNVLQRALILHTGEMLDEVDLRFENDTPPVTAETDPRLQDDLKVHEQRLILDALHGERSRKAAAERLGISPRTLRYKIARLREQGVDLGQTGAELA
jgi:two-component system response regulator FlrC